MTLAKLQSILTERNDDPLVRGYQAIPTRGVTSLDDYLADTTGDEAYLAAVNAVDRPAPIAVDIVIRHLMSISKYVAVVDSINESARNFSKRLEIASDTISTIDLQDTDVLVDLNAMATAGILTRGEADGIIALGANQRSRSQELGDGITRQRDLGRVRVEFQKGLIT